jgi:uncharacterized protein
LVGPDLGQADRTRRQASSRPTQSATVTEAVRLSQVDCRAGACRRAAACRPAAALRNAYAFRYEIHFFCRFEDTPKLAPYPIGYRSGSREAFAATLTRSATVSLFARWQLHRDSKTALLPTAATLVESFTHVYRPGPMHLSGLFIYPVKSLRGFAVPAASVDALGLEGDRRFLVIDENATMLTQRVVPRMALVAAALSTDALTLSADGAGSISVGRASNPAAPLHSVTVWRSSGLRAEDCGEPAARWLTEILGVKCRLVRGGAAFNRPVLKPRARAGDVVSFADSVPFLVVSEASLADLNDRLVATGSDAVPMNRFRPNLVVSGCAAFAEDGWERFQIGEMIFRAAGPCSRCIVTTTDQFTGKRDKEPLRTLAAYRRDPEDPTDVNFGQNVIHETKSGQLRVGDAVKVL